MTDRRLTTVSRRAALLAPLALTGCGLFDSWFGEKKMLLPGKRESIFSGSKGLAVGENPPKVVLPPPVRNADWPQAGGNPAHAMGHLAAGANPQKVWSADIGDGGGYRAILMAQPVVLDKTVFTMDSDAVVSAFTLADGQRMWRADSKPKDSDSTNVGGGIGADGTTLYAANGLGQLVAFDAASGKEKWRATLDAPARSAPMIADGRVFVTTIMDQLTAFSAADGHHLWSYQSTTPTTAMLGQPAPAYYRGLVVAGFGSGDLACVRAENGSMVWIDGLGAAGQQGSVASFLSIRGAPAIVGSRVYAISMGGLLVCDDVPSGRRLWERQVAGEDAIHVAGDWMFFVTADQEIAAVRLSDGTVGWVTPLPRWEDPEKKKQALTWFGPLLVSDRLIVNGTSQEALSVSPYTGAILGRISLSDQAAPFAPIVADGTILLVTNDARLIALR